METVAAWLGKRAEEVKRMVEEDGLPALPLMSEKRTRLKFAASGLTSWLNRRAKNQRLTIDEVIAELDRCAPHVGDPVIKSRLGKVTELRALCDAAERTLRGGADCPRLVRAIVNVVDELKAEGCA